MSERLQFKAYCMLVNLLAQAHDSEPERDVEEVTDLLDVAWLKLDYAERAELDKREVT